MYSRQQQQKCASVNERHLFNILKAIRRSGTSQMIDLVYIQVDRIDNIIINDMEARIADVGLIVLVAASEKIV